MAKTSADIRSLARSHTATAVRTLAGIMKERRAPAAARVSAAIAVLDRGWGKPQQAIEMDWRQKPPDQMTDEELIALIRETKSLTSPANNEIASFDAEVGKFTGSDD